MIMVNSYHDNSSTNVCLPGIVLKSAFIPNKLSVCCLNMQSMCARRMVKFEEFSQILSVSSVDVACVCETWLNETRSDEVIKIDGYRAIRSDRIGKTGGGLLMYLKKCYKYKMLESSSVEIRGKYIEYIFIELSTSNDKILVGLIYNHPDLDCSEIINDKLTSLGTSYNNLLLIGDFNTNLMIRTPKTERFHDMLASLCLFSVGQEPTFFYSTGSSQLDLLITDKPESVLRFGQVSVPNISHHDLIFASMNYDIQLTNEETFYRDYRAIDPNAVIRQFNDLNWSNFYTNVNPNILVEIFNDNLKCLHDSCVPLRKVKKKYRTNNPWFSTSIQKALIDRDRAYKKWKLTKNNNDFNEFKILRNLSNRLITQAKRNYYNTQLSGDMSSKDFWHKIRKLGLGKSSSIIECDFSPDAINTSFQNNFSLPIQSTMNTSASNQNSFSFRSVRVFEIINAVHEVKSNAVGLDDIPIKFIKCILPLLLGPLIHIFNSIIETSIYPKAWKMSKLIPFRKKPNSASLENLRPISILSALSKVFERILKSQICSHIHNNNLLSPFQSGYRPGHSTKTAMLKICDDIGVMLDKGDKVVLILLDFSKAFDTISHSLLCYKLEHRFNFKRTAVSLIHSYLVNRHQAVYCNQILSSFLPVFSGVPQGSVLGPILFSLYINDLPSVIKYCSLHLFADDVQLYFDCGGRNISEINTMINRDLEAVRMWSTRNALRLNASKTQALFIRRNANGEYPSLNIDNETISFVDSAKSLGFIIQSDFNWDKHILSQCGRVYSCLRTLYSKKHVLHHSTKLKIFKSFIMPHFISCDFLIGCASVLTQERLRIALNSCIRFIFNLGRMDSVTHLQQSLLGYSFYNFMRARSCILLHKVITTRTPAYLYEKLKPFRSTRVRQFVIPAHNSSLYGKTLFVRGVVSWNSLPSYLQNQESIFMFKKQCKEHFNWSRIG